MLAGGATLSATAQAPFVVPGAPRWQWQSPSRGGYNLLDVHVFDDQSAFAVGNHGAALKTTDQGRTWNQVWLGMDYDLKSVSFVSPLVGWVAYDTPSPSLTSQTGRGEIRRTGDGGRTWAVQPIGEPSDVEMKSVRFLSATEGYVHYYYNAPSLGRPARLRLTHNGGQSWVPVPVPNATRAVQFLTPLLGYLSGPGFVQKTTDGGLTFTAVTPASAGSIAFDQLSFVNAQTGWVSSPSGGSAPNFYHTTNGGTTWSPVQIYPLSPNYYAPAMNLFFCDALHGTAGQHVTVDGGQTWAIAFGAVSQGTTRLRSSGVGFSVDVFGRLVTTTDFGLTGREDNPGVGGVELSRVNFPDPVHGWAFGGNYGRLFRPSGRGQAWTRVDVAAAAPSVDWTAARLQAGAFPDTDTAALAGYEFWGQPAQAMFVLRTEDGGQRWTRQPLAGARSVNDLQFRDCRYGLLVGDAGEVWYTHDGGQSWQRGTSGTTQHLLTASWAGPTTAYARGTGSTFLKTLDSGATWQPVPNTFFSDPSRFSNTNVQFITPRLGFTTSSNLFRTTDGGQTWTFASSARNVNGVSFVSAREGWAYGQEVYHTTDAGQTWTQQVDVGQGQLSGSFIDRYNGWVVGFGGTIVRYSEKFIAARPLAQTTYCAGGTLALAFDTTGQFPTTERRFAAQLSNARGRFRPGQIRVVGQGTASPLAVTLPFDVPAGSAYRLRVVQADSLVLGADTGQNLTINPAAAATIAPAGPQTLCAGRTLTLSAPAGQAQYLWSTGATTPTLAVTAGGTYAVRVAGANGCLGPPSAAVTVRLVPLPAPPVIRQSPGGQLSVTPLAGATYQWTRNGTAIAGATAASYPATGAAPVGTYTAVVTNGDGCASAASAPLVVVLATRPALAADFSLYPNPTPAAFIVERPAGGGAARVVVLDALGRCAWQQALPPQQTRLAGPPLPGGAYQVLLYLASGEVVGRRLVVVP